MGGCSGVKTAAGVWLGCSCLSRNEDVCGRLWVGHETFFYNFTYSKVGLLDCSFCIKFFFVLPGGVILYI